MSSSSTPNIQPIPSAFALFLLTTGGGLTGYIRTGSMPSLIAGCGVGSLYLAGALLMRNYTEPNYGNEVALLASVVLAGSSIPRALRGGKPLPVGLSVMAVFGCVLFGNGVWKGYAGKGIKDA